MEFLILPALLVVGYLLGSMSFSIMIVDRFFRKDIRDYGSGNAGMTNVLRNFGKWPAVFTFVFDFLKGAVSAALGLLLCTYVFPAVPAMLGAYAGGIGAVAGHLYPAYYHFKGGSSFRRISCGVPVHQNGLRRLHCRCGDVPAVYAVLPCPVPGRPVVDGGIGACHGGNGHYQAPRQHCAHCHRAGVPLRPEEKGVAVRQQGRIACVRHENRKRREAGEFSPAFLFY